MRILTESFRGMAPRLTPRALPPNGAQIATNAKLLSGDLEAYRQFLLTQTLANEAPVRTIYLLDDAWLSWGSQVDVARGIIPGDDTFRTYLTGPDEYGEPRWTNYALATTGAEPFPVVTRPIGVPGPDSVPTLVVSPSTDPTTFSVNVTDEGNELATDWATGPQTSAGSTVALIAQDAAFGNPAPSYRLTADENEGQAAYMYRNFGMRDCTSINFEFDFYLSSGGLGFGSQMICGVNRSATGVGLGVTVASGAMAICQAGNWGSTQLSALASVAVGAIEGVWYRMRVGININTDNTQTVTATLLQGATVLGTITATNLFEQGEYCGFSMEIGLDSPSQFNTWYDNIVAQGSGSLGDTIINVATSYVFTYVNDIGEESAPSLPSATILRPDGVTVTITTPTDLPSGVSSEYGITSKRIYRAVTGPTGSIFRLVAEVPLATADYVDDLTDAELGEELESEGWDLPPDDLEGILALPNGIMCGFRRNQLCFSAQNRPHAWPVAARLNTDTDIVGIGAIDTTVVIGTQSFPYLAIGSSTGDYSMSKLEVPQAAVAKQSFASLTGIGVVFASPDGLIAVGGTGQVQNLTSGIYTREQWQALQPESIIAAAHDDTYFFWPTPASPPAAVEIGWHSPISGGTPARLNSGTGVCSDFAESDIVTQLRAGVVDYAGQSVTWSIAEWTPTAGGASPVLTLDEEFPNFVRVDWRNSNGDGPPIGDASLGSLILTATVDGVPIATGERLIVVTTSASPYPSIAWGPE